MKDFKIQNFKCFRNFSVPINSLTILAGANGNGKSSVLQALLLLRSTIERCSKLNKKDDSYPIPEQNDLVPVELNGTYNLALGYSEYIIPENSNNSTVELIFSENSTSFGVTYEAGEAELYLSPIAVKGNSRRPMSLFKHEFYYLNAERLGPRIKQEIKYYDFPNTGYQGEFAAQLLGDTNFNYSFKVDDKRKYPQIQSPRIEQQTNAWLKDMLPGVSVSSSYNVTAMSAQIMITNHFTQGTAVLAPNIGFGISYVLPIVISGLIAKEGSFLIIENPEAHLHPSAQSKIGRFLALIAHAGVNVIVETHSDHVLNGVQLACAKKEIDPNLVTINYFSCPDESEQPALESISVTDKGELTSWPRGFFDQSQADFSELFRLRKI